MYQRAEEPPMIPGYDYDAPGLPHSPISLEELDLLKQTVLFTDDDRAALQQAGNVLANQVDEILDVWYAFVGNHPHLLHYFSSPEEVPLPNYLERVRARFGQWILDTCFRPYDQIWLNYQYEIAQRHYRTKKNHADGVDAAPIIHYRYIVAFIYPLTATVKPFLAKGGHPAEQIERMYQAWCKAVTLQAALWAYPYIKEGNF